MKKTLIAGASLILATMPMAGVFAATGDGATSGDSSYTDDISLTIDKNCTFSRGSTAHTNGSSSVGTWNNTTHTLSATFTNGSNKANFGSSSFVVTCNNTAGYKVTLATTGLTSSGNTIPNNKTYSSSVSGWSPVISSTKLVNGDTVKQETSSVNNSSFTVSYGIGISTTQPAGTYTGTAVYTFAQL